MELTNRNFVIVGGTSGIGKATAQLALDKGASVEILGRSVVKRIGNVEFLDHPLLTSATLDMTDEAAVKNYFEGKTDESIDTLVISASSTTHGPFGNADTYDIQKMFSSKFIGPYVVAREALTKMKAGGSITFFSGVLSRRPSKNGAGLAAVNAAVEALGRALALELGPRLRVNTLSPGMTLTDTYADMPEHERNKMFRAVANTLPLARIADPKDIAEAVLFLSTNPFMTGHVLDVDGGHMVAG